MCLIPMISKRYGHMSSGESPGLNVPTISFSRDLETVEVFWTTQPQPSIPMRQRVELPLNHLRDRARSAPWKGSHSE